MPTPKQIEFDQVGKIFDFSNEEWDDSRNEKNLTQNVTSPVDPLIISFSQTMNQPVLELIEDNEGTPQGSSEHPSMNFENENHND